MGSPGYRGGTALHRFLRGLLPAAGALTCGCNGAMWGNFLVVGITVGIFVATLSLGRATLTRSRRSKGDASSTSSTERAP